MAEWIPWASEHWFLFACLAWWVIVVALGVAWLVASLVEDLLNACARVWSRSLRAVIVSVRGWPPPHLDADGDWRPSPKGEAPE